jgi:hypothetical protein
LPLDLSSSFVGRHPNMADVISFAPQHEEELSDEQMQEMLVQAARRRQENASVALLDKDDKDKANQFIFPKLNTGDMIQPYVSNAGDVATVDRSRLLSEADRKLSNQIRKVDDPVAVKKKTIEVCFEPFFSLTLPCL